MPRAVTERLIGYSAGLNRETLRVPKMEVTADGGQPTVLHDEVEMTILTFFDTASGHKVEIPLLDEDRRALVSGLSGGIEIATSVPRPA
jgi:hypothetical protein